MMDEPLLDVRDVSLSFRGVKALSELSFSVATARPACLSDRTGRESSLLNIINGVYRASSGQIIFDGDRFSGRRPWCPLSAGIVCFGVQKLYAETHETVFLAPTAGSSRSRPLGAC
jgi:branched-chain amino acid transport system ATP-binding protein